MMTQFLADFMISGDWLVGAIILLIPVIGTVWLKAKKVGLQEGIKTIAIQDPVPEVPVKRVYSPPSFSQHMDVVRRIEVLEGNVAELRRDQAIQFLKLMEVGERRKDDILERFETVARGFHDRVDQIIKKGRIHGA